MDKQYDEFVGVDNLHTALILTDSETEYTAETPEYFAPTAEIVNDTEVDIQSTYYDNVSANSYVSEGGTTVTMTVSGVPAKKAAKYLGKHYDEASGRVLDTGDPNPPDVALSFRYNRGKNSYRYYQYLKGKFSGGTEEAATKTESYDIKTYQLTFTAVVTTKQWPINGEMKGMKKIYADTVDEQFNPSTWFNQVQTPDTASTPTALTLVESLPADEATAVAVDSNVVLTFSNKTMSHMITLFDNTFSPVAIAISKDATGKIVTVNPVANLSASTSYTLIITNAIDIHGQKIENQVVGFTTA
jgi:phi13 family phage major tail protein